MVHITDKKQMEAVIRLNERMQWIESFNLSKETKQFNDNVTIAMLWCITQ
ncbi:MAG: hypothetical protein IJF03_09920 [Lachnospiraceae bacterium]|nr:hypothetical protein [Lachnospiraceae bacterium]